MADNDEQKWWSPDRGKADEQTIEDGKIISHGGNKATSGTLFEDGRTLFIGDTTENVEVRSEAEDTIYGTSRDDVAIIGKPDEDIYGNGKTLFEKFEGGEGYDTAFISGSREDYIISVPNIDDYPAQGDHRDLYGSTIVLEHAETGNILLLKNVESMIFDNGVDQGNADYSITTSLSKFDHALNEIDNGVESGAFTEVSFEEAFLQAEHDVIIQEGPEALDRYKAASTPEFRQAFTDLGQDINSINEAIDNALEAIGDREIETNLPDGQPTTEATADRIGAPQPETPASLPDFGRWR